MKTRSVALLFAFLTLCGIALGGGSITGYNIASAITFSSAVTMDTTLGVTGISTFTGGLGGQLTWGTGLGTIDHILGPTDQKLALRPGSGQGLILQSADGTDVIEIGNSIAQIRGVLRIIDDSTIALGSGAEDRFLQGEGAALVDDSATEFVAIQSSLGDAGGVVITYTCKLTDSGGVRATKTGILTVKTLDGAAGVSASISDGGTVLEDTGTTTFVFAIDNTDDGDLEITCQTTTDLTPTAITITWSANASGDVTLLAQ